jgi:large subunit ribosomal protein L25
MEIIKLNAARRTESGKGPSHRLRRAGQIPAIAYGRDLAALPVAVSPKSLLGVLTSPLGQNSVLELDVEGGEKLTVMVRDYSYHPISRELVHADFVQVKLDQPVDVDVPFICTGKSKGVVGGGILQVIYRRIPVRALPAQIPASIEVDISELDVGDSIKASLIKVPEGVKLRVPDEQTVVVVNAPEKVVEEEPKPGAAAAAAAGAAAAPGAPGAAAAAPAAAGAAAAAPAKAAEKAPAKGEKKK